MLQECFLHGMYVPSCYSWPLVAVDMPVGGIDPQDDCLWGFFMTTEYKLLCGSWSYEADFAPVGSGTFWDHPLGMQLWG